MVWLLGYVGCEVLNRSDRVAFWCVVCVCLLWWLGRFKAVWLSKGCVYVVMVKLGVQGLRVCGLRELEQV